MSDINAVWANRLACRWAEQFLKLPEGSVESVEYSQEQGGGGCDTCGYGGGDITYMYAHLKQPMPDPNGSIWPVTRLDIFVDIGEAVAQMLDLAERQ